MTRPDRDRGHRGGYHDDVMPSTLRGGNRKDFQDELTPQQRADQLIRNAEAAKAKILATPGNFIDLNKEFIHSVMVDEAYSVVAAHVDEVTYGKIIKGQYVDFSKLIAKDKIAEEEEELLQLVRKNGKTFYTPVKDGTTITNFGRWEQAFRVFSNIYMQEYPHHSSQLIQYNHIIHDISQTYLWSNVYAYDRDFHIHMAKNPQRSWAIILQQSWSMRLKEKISYSEYHPRVASGSLQGDRTTPQRGKGGEPCRRFNRGKCNFGNNCKYDHRCSYCYKFGHTVLTCRKASADCSDRSRGGGNNRSKGHSIDKDVVARK